MSKFSERLKLGASRIGSKAKELAAKGSAAVKVSYDKYQAEAKEKREYQKELRGVQVKAMRDAEMKEAAKYGEYQAKQKYANMKKQSVRPQGVQGQSSPLSAFGNGSMFGNAGNVLGGPAFSNRFGNAQPRPVIMKRRVRIPIKRKMRKKRARKPKYRYVVRAIKQAPPSSPFNYF